MKLFLDMLYKFIIQRIPKIAYRGLEFPEDLQQSLLQLKEHLAKKFNLVFEAGQYFSEKKDYYSLKFTAKEIQVKIIADDNTKSYQVIIDHNFPSWQTYLTEALETHFDVYSKEELWKNVKNPTKSRKRTISQLVDGTLTGDEVDPEILSVLEEALKDKDPDLKQEILWSLPDTPYLPCLRPIIEQMRVRDLDEGIQITLDYFFDYEFSSQENSEEEIEISMSLEAQSLEEVPTIVLESVHLEELSLAENKLKSLPSELANLTKLRKLSVRSNLLKALPQSLSQLPHLEVIFAYHNQIQEFPHLPASIKEVYLGKNQIKVIPVTIEHLIALEWLNIEDNEIQEIHPNISQLSALEYLDLSGNPLQRIPEGVTQLSKLKTLCLFNCPLEELNDSFSGLKELRILEITETNIKEIKPSIEQLTSLQKLTLNKSKIANIPHEIVLPQDLRSLSLSQGNLKYFPLSITRLKKIERLFLPFNFIEELPDEIEQCKSLKYLCLSDNKLKKLPDSFWHLTGLKELWLDNNLFSENLKESIYTWAKQNQISLTI